jgi:S-adenosylmethionine:tRNA ribosyltransferase-isomerase
MIRKPQIEIKDYYYDLPEESIAQFPLEQRDASKLLIWKNGMLSEDLFSQIDLHIPDGSMMVFNDTKVIRARIIFTKPTGSTIEIFCLEPYLSMDEKDDKSRFKGVSTWQCLIGNVKRWKEGRIEKKVIKNGESICLTAEKKANLGDGCFSVEFRWEPDSLTFPEILESVGLVPLPPYIHRSTIATDTFQYQTIFAKYDGSVAAPTAGLHFTHSVFDKLSRKNISMENVTLHVGLGTFRPVSSPEIAHHIMHEEKINVKLDTLLNLIEHPDLPVIAVGTTSVRTLETLYWAGVKLLVDKLDELPDVDQWDPYNDQYNCGISKHETLQKLVDTLRKKDLSSYSGSTRILIAPGYQMRMTKGMITNFHMPQSTLLLLIAAFIGSGWKEAYDYALRNGFRFLSYGDACLLLNTIK